MTKSALAFVFLLIVGNAFAQRQLTGKVIDSQSLAPLSFANVYVNNSTIGTTTNDAGEFTLKNIPPGNVEVIFSFLGYHSYQIRMPVGDGPINPVVVRLVASEEKLTEIELSETRDKNWDKQLKKFEKVFLGDGGMAADCKIKNAWVIDFAGGNGVLVAKASQPIEIENRSLGYKVYFQLKDFKYTGVEYSIIGNIRFEELSAGDAREAVLWMKNREQIYRGSFRHLIKAILDHKIAKEGFQLYTDRVNGTPRTDKFSYELEHNVIPYDTSSLISAGTTIGERKIAFRNKVEVHNIYEFVGNSFYKDITYPVSWIEVKGGSVRVNNEGAILNATDIVISGDMSQGRVASMLPLDYQKGNLIPVMTKETRQALRLREKVYLHTDKPYYYRGENVWLSAYMNYKSLGARDSLSQVLYVDLIKQGDFKPAVSLTLPIDGGRAAGGFLIPTDVPSGNYYLRAYTEWMRNYGNGQFFYKSFPLLLPYNSIDDGELPTPLVNEQLKVSFDKPVYKTRDRISVKLSVPDEEMKTGATLSMSVTDESQVVPVADAVSIDHDFDFEEARSKNMYSRFTYPIERGISMKGTYTNKKGKADKGLIIVLPANLETAYQAVSDDHGKFELRDLAFYDSMKFAFQLKDGQVKLDTRDKPAMPATLPLHSLPVITKDTVQRALTGNIGKSVLLQAVELKVKKEQQRSESAYGTADYYIKGDDMGAYASVAIFVSVKIPAYKLVQQMGHWFLIWARGEFSRANGPPSEPVLFVDNVQFVTNPNETAGDRLNSFNPATIDHIEVSNMIGSNLGANGANGAIYVFTKRATPDKFKSLPVYSIKGFDRTPVFTSPDYSLPNADEAFDNRTTLYWNPSIYITPSKGEATVSFYASDQTGKYRVVVEGITSKGVPIHTEAVIVVEQ